MRSTIAATAFMALSTGINAQSLSTQCFSDICYQLNIPETTARSGAGDIYFQISGPSSYSWIGLGQGTGMAGANIFVVYADGQGNVTLSPRQGVGHVEPEHDTTANVTLLEGSGVSNGRMVANVLCQNCDSWNGGTTDFTGSSGDWIHAALSGKPINSQSVDAEISYHSAYGPFTWGYTKAQGGSSTVNPFVTTQSSTSNGNGGDGGVSSAPTSVPAGSGGDSDDDGSGSTVEPSNMMIIAHGTVAAVAFLVIFPIGAFSLRVPALGVWFHAGIQIFAYLCFVGAGGLGIYIAQAQRQLTDAHPIIGMVLLGALFFQPLFGVLHHRMYKAMNRRTAGSYIHIWVGRACVLLGMINGGLGIQLAGGIRQGYIIAYGVVAGVMGLLFIANMAYGESQVSKRSKVGTTEERKDESSTRA